jgi:hypothetical protein
VCSLQAAIAVLEAEARSKEFTDMKKKLDDTRRQLIELQKGFCCFYFISLLTLFIFLSLITATSIEPNTHHPQICPPDPHPQSPASAPSRIFPRYVFHPQTRNNHGILPDIESASDVLLA